MSLDKFKKALEKKDKFNIGMSPIPDWISTGNAALNNIISGDMRLGVPVGRSTIIGGLQGSGKSFIISNIAKNAQEKGYFVVYIDTEFSVGEGFMEKIGVSMDEDKFMAVNISIIEEAIEFVADLFKNTTKEDKIFLALDSLSNLQPEGDAKKFDDSRVAYGQGLREKMLKQLVNAINSRVGGRNISFVTTTHLYVNGSDAYGNPIMKPNVGEGTLYIPSVGLELSKNPLRDGKSLVGINVKCKTFKTRYTQLGKTCTFALPWDSGMEFLDGSLEVLEEAGVVERNGGWLKYVNKSTGDEIKFQKSTYHEHADLLMEYYAEKGGEVVEKEEDEANIEMVTEK